MNDSSVQFGVKDEGRGVSVPIRDCSVIEPHLSFAARTMQDAQRSHVSLRS